MSSGIRLVSGTGESSVVSNLLHGTTPEEPNETNPDDHTAMDLSTTHCAKDLISSDCGVASLSPASQSSRHYSDLLQYWKELQCMVPQVALRRKLHARAEDFAARLYVAKVAKLSSLVASIRHKQELLNQELAALSEEDYVALSIQLPDLQGKLVAFRNALMLSPVCEFDTLDLVAELQRSVQQALDATSGPVYLDAAADAELRDRCQHIKKHVGHARERRDFMQRMRDMPLVHDAAVGLALEDLQEQSAQLALSEDDYQTLPGRLIELARDLQRRCAQLKFNGQYQALWDLYAKLRDLDYLDLSALELQDACALEHSTPV